MRFRWQEFGLGMPTDKCSSATEASQFCEPVTYAAGEVLCGNSAFPMASNLSCLAKGAALWVSVNTCEDAPEGNYNAQLVFDDQGRFVTNYR